VESAQNGAETFLNFQNMKVRLVIEKHFLAVWFLSTEVQRIYKEEFKEFIGLSTISTYLSRMADRGFLMKNQTSGHRRYRRITEIMKRVVIR